MVIDEQPVLAQSVSATENTRAELVDAARFVCRHARSVEDARQLLDALGLEAVASEGGQ